MKKFLLPLFFLVASVRADYAAWLEFTPIFKARDYEENSTMEVAWESSVEWPTEVAKHIRLPNPLSHESRERLIGSFGKGPWGVLERSNDGKGYIVFTRSPEQDFPGEGEPLLMGPAEKEAKIREILASIGYPVETLIKRKRRAWKQSEGPLGKEIDTVSGLEIAATIGGYRLLSSSAYEVSFGFDRYQRTFEARLVWRKTKVDGEFHLVTKENAEKAILEGKSRTYNFGFGGELGTTLSKKEKDAYMLAYKEAQQRKKAGLPPLPGPTVSRKVLVKSAELVLLDYAGAEGPDGTEKATVGRFDDILWPMLIFQVDLVTDGNKSSGELMLPADAAWFNAQGQNDRPASVRIGPPARSRR